jgi:predicted DCC family thiol-disulfide oxidoreductase YuxK
VKHSWTGGQYSVWRAYFGIALAIPLALSVDGALEPWYFRLPSALLCFALVAGVHDRVAAWLLAAVWWYAEHGRLPEWSPGAWSICALLLLHATTHGSPYGTIDARGRTDPAGGWILPRWNLAARRLLVLAAAGASLVRGHLEMPWSSAAALLLSAADPGWIPPRCSEAPTRVFYDGACGLCHRFVRFLLAEDRTGVSFRFAPLQGETFSAAFPADARQSYPDSIVVQDEDGRALIRSRAVLHTLDRLGGLWRAVGALARIVPRPIRDWTYDGVAVVRHWIFARRNDACPLVPAHLTRRFEP